MSTDMDTRPVEEVAASVGVSVGALAIRPDQTTLDDAQRKALGHIGLQDCGDADVTAFLHLCQRTGLDPWARQIYLINRREKIQGTEQYRDKWQPQTGIDGFRIIASRHGELYRGQTAPEWCDDDGVWKPVWLNKQKPPAAARVGVLRSDRDEPVWGIAVFTEFAQYNFNGKLTKMWETKSSHMIAKCAEAAALRKAFPQDMAGLTIPEEMEANRPTTRVESQRVAPSGPIDNSELTGQPAPKDTPKKSDAPKASGEKSTGDKMTGEQQKTFLRLRREADVGDAKAYASQHLGRTINSLGELTQGDAAKLIENLEGMLGADEPGQPEVVDAEVVDEGQATTEQPAAEQ